MTPDAEELKAWKGRTETAQDTVTAAPVRMLRATLDLPPDDGVAELPPLWHWLYFLPSARQSELGPDGHPRRGGFLPPVPLPRRMWAGGQLEFFSPLRVGDAIRRVSTIDDVKFKSGRTGELCFVRVRHEVSSPRGLALREFHDIVYRPDPVPGAAEPAYEAAPESVLGAPRRARRHAAVPLFGAHLQRPPHPLRPALRDAGRRLSGPGRARAADGHLARRACATPVRRAGAGARFPSGP